MNHILTPVPDRPGDFKTLNGKDVSVRDRLITTGARFSKRVVAKVCVCVCYGRACVCVCVEMG